jgi:hypothetical protein
MIAGPLSSALKGETGVDDPKLFESDTFPDSWNIAIGYVLAGVRTSEARKAIKATQFPDASQEPPSTVPDPKFGSFLANKLDASPSFIITEELSVTHNEFVRTLQSHSSTRVNLINSGFLVPSDETASTSTSPPAISSHPLLPRPAPTGWHPRIRRIVRGITRHVIRVDRGTPHPPFLPRRHQSLNGRSISGSRLGKNFSPVGNFIAHGQNFFEPNKK